MNLRFSFKEMTEMFSATYRTLDIRSAAVKQGDKWANVYAVIRMTYEEPAVAAERLHRLQKIHGTARSESFRVLLGLRPFSELGEFWKDLGLGRLCVGDEEVRLAQPLGVMLDRERSYLQPDYSSIRPFDSRSWPVAHYRLLPYGSSPLMDEALARDAARLGYSDADEAANLLCEINIRAGQSNGHHFWLSAPVFASIQDIRASLKERRMEVSILRHRKLSTLKGMAIFSRPRTFAGEPPKFRMSIEKFSDGGGTADLHSASASVRLLKVGEDDSVEVKLLQPDLGELHSRVSWSIRELLRPSERNILFEALKHFCPEPELGLLLGSPHKKKSKNLKPSAAFELHVAWLLGCFGLSTAVLGEYEHIVAPETKVRRGSVDILAASQRHRRLVLVACTIGAPKEDDFTNVVNMAEIISREVFAGTDVRVQGLVCTSVQRFPASKDIVEGLMGLPILDGDRLELLLRLIGAARERDFFSFLNNPMHSELREPE